MIVPLIQFRLSRTGASCSPLSANIYFPAIPTLVLAFDKSVELIKLTVTSNMVFQGISSMFWGTLLDSYGRRHGMFILCLLLLALSCIGLALTPTRDYWLLLFLRCFQAVWSASTVGIGAGFLGDISARAERAGFLGAHSIGTMVRAHLPRVSAPTEDIPGWALLTRAWGHIPFACFLPETLCVVVGNGSVLPPTIYYPVVPVIGRHTSKSGTTARPVFPRKAFQNPLRLLLHVDVALLLISNGFVYSVFYGVTASISTVFYRTYPQLSEAELGLCFLTVGGGIVFGSLFCGKVLDRDYQRVRRTETTDDAFPIEKARVRLSPVLLAVFVTSCIGYAWCIDRRTNIAGLVILLLGVGLVSIAVMNLIQTLMLDLIPQKMSSITACNNLVRSGLGAGMVSVIQPLLDALGTGYAYLFLGGISALMGPWCTLSYA
ncbi:major facilitator superfamily domain-containing protein [Mycena rosella]|uniref:Major facilitator superfamily domain-containing protein n=1 Tax=Mycena rosella TaxID=1033263 RepID=A0AAD7DQ89_MYCRO|nr:major facilitator superfamily domain-containing protein [Mycena rosella]